MPGNRKPSQSNVPRFHNSIISGNRGFTFSVDTLVRFASGMTILLLMARNFLAPCSFIVIPSLPTDNITNVAVVIGSNHDKKMNIIVTNITIDLDLLELQ